jgi:hypothetical protein
MAQRKSMSRGRAWALGVSAVLLVIGVPIALSTRPPNVDRDDYVAANLHLLARLPVFPGAKAEGVLSEPWQVRQDPYGRPYTTGYSTRATFSVPARTKAGDVDRYFRKALHSWHMASVGTVQEGWPHPLGQRHAATSSAEATTVAMRACQSTSWAS